jgi:hypothetical protein
MKEDERNGACSTHGREMRNACRFLVRNAKDRSPEIKRQ